MRLLTPLEVETSTLTPRARIVAETVSRLFKNRGVLSKIAEVAQEIPLFSRLNSEQIKRLASLCAASTFEPGEIIFQEGSESDRIYVLLKGQVDIAITSVGRSVGLVTSGQCLGEVSVLTNTPHSATAIARTAVEAAVLDRPDLTELVRLRPDIGIELYKNLAMGLGEKLKRSDLSTIRL